MWGGVEQCCVVPHLAHIVQYHSDMKSREGLSDAEGALEDALRALELRRRDADDALRALEDALRALELRRRELKQLAQPEAVGATGRG